MKIYLRLLVFCTVLLPFLAFGDAEELVECEDGLAPEMYVAPKFPPRLHNEYEGKAIISFVVNESGEVIEPLVISSQWKPVGHSGHGPIGYNEAILAAVVAWKYPSRQKACRAEAPVVVRFEH
jgi:hypothetical protein